MNPYPKTITDEASGIEVSSELYKAYQEGIKEVVKWVNQHGCIEQRDPVWQSKIKEWSIDTDSNYHESTIPRIPRGRE